MISQRTTRLALAAATLAALAALGGCSTSAKDSPDTIPLPQRTPTSAPHTPTDGPTGAQHYSFTGTGPETISIPIPTVNISYLIGSWTVSPACGSGGDALTMVEDTRFTQDTCGGGKYQFTLPDDTPSTVHLTVDVPAGATFTVSGAIVPGA
jgi:hypothetical protein